MIVLPTHCNDLKECIQVALSLSASQPHCLSASQRVYLCMVPERHSIPYKGTPYKGITIQRYYSYKGIHTKVLRYKGVVLIVRNSNRPILNSNLDHSHRHAAPARSSSCQWTLSAHSDSVRTTTQLSIPYRSSFQSAQAAMTRGRATPSTTVRPRVAANSRH